MDDRPFEDPPNTAALTMPDVLEAIAPILHVAHDGDDGSWQFSADLSREAVAELGVSRRSTSSSTTRS